MHNAGNHAVGRDKTVKRLAALFLAVALAGCETNPSRPAPLGTQVTGKALVELISGAVVYGRYYSTKNRDIERHHIGGRYTVVSTKSPDAQSYDSKETGTWRIDGNQVCYEVDAANASGCALVFKLNGQLEFVDPVTRTAWSLASKIEYEKEAPPVAAGTSPPVAATVPATPRPPGQRKLLGSGSGFIVSSQTHVLTNEHVIEKCAEITVRIDDRDIRAIVGVRDGRNDLALLRLPAGKYPVAVVGDHLPCDYQVCS